MVLRVKHIFFRLVSNTYYSVFFTTFAPQINKGSVVQLYRTSDSGSEGRRLESCRSHQYETTQTTRIYSRNKVGGVQYGWRYIYRAIHPCSYFNSTI